VHPGCLKSDLLIIGKPLVDVCWRARCTCCFCGRCYGGEGWPACGLHLGGAAMGAPDPVIQASGRPLPCAAPGARSSASTSLAASEGARSAVHKNDRRHAAAAQVDKPDGHTTQRPRSTVIASLLGVSKRFFAAAGSPERSSGSASSDDRTLAAPAGEPPAPAPCEDSSHRSPAWLGATDRADDVLTPRCKYVPNAAPHV
jgi:hypothetical protein